MRYKEGDLFLRINPLQPEYIIYKCTGIDQDRGEFTHLHLNAINEKTTGDSHTYVPLIFIDKYFKKIDNTQVATILFGDNYEKTDST